MVNLVVVSNVKKVLKKVDLRTSKDLTEELSKKLVKLLVASAKVAKAEGMMTVKAKHLKGLDQETILKAVYDGDQ